MSKQHSAYTMVELLISLTIIGLLAGVIFPVGASAKERARQARCISNLKQIGVAMMMYFEDWGRYPVHLDMLADVENLPDEVLVCPSDPDNGARAAWEPRSWLARPLSYTTFSFLSPVDRASYYLFYNVWLKNDPLAGPLVVCDNHTDTARPDPRYLAVYADGHVAWCRFYSKDYASHMNLAPWPFMLD
ncbi:MAG: type II secretion system GspH family protein [Anaerolineae bacterium]|nr:type II secretion system GspH family protein [Anaerolineae bacterium]